VPAPSSALPATAGCDYPKPATQEPLLLLLRPDGPARPRSGSRTLGAEPAPGRPIATWRRCPRQHQRRRLFRDHRSRPSDPAPASPFLRSASLSASITRASIVRIGPRIDHAALDLLRRLSAGAARTRGRFAGFRATLGGQLTRPSRRRPRPRLSTTDLTRVAASPRDSPYERDNPVQTSDIQQHRAQTTNDAPTRTDFG
jgi:hypothetical protein